MQTFFLAKFNKYCKNNAKEILNAMFKILKYFNLWAFALHRLIGVVVCCVNQYWALRGSRCGYVMTYIHIRKEIKLARAEEGRLEIGCSGAKIVF